MATAQRKPLDLDHFRTQLTKLKAQLESDLEANRERAIQIEGGPDEPGPGNHWERSGYGDHQGDDATEVFEKEKSIGMEQTLAEHIRAVDHALARLADGTYGTCESCGRPIGDERLRAMPEATLCLECKSAAERQNPAFSPTTAATI